MTVLNVSSLWDNSYLYVRVMASDGETTVLNMASADRVCILKCERYGER